MTRDAAKALIQKFRDLMQDIDDADTDETDIWTDAYWRLSDEVEALEEYYKS